MVKSVVSHVDSNGMNVQLKLLPRLGIASFIHFAKTCKGDWGFGCWICKRYLKPINKKDNCVSGIRQFNPGSLSWCRPEPNLRWDQLQPSKVRRHAATKFHMHAVKKLKSFISGSKPKPKPRQCTAPPESHFKDLLFNLKQEPVILNLI